MPSFETRYTVSPEVDLTALYYGWLAELTMDKCHSLFPNITKFGVMLYFIHKDRKEREILAGKPRPALRKEHEPATAEP